MFKTFWKTCSLLLLLIASPAVAETYAHYFSVARTAAGVGIPSGTVTVQLAGTSTAATLYNDGSGAPKSNPFLTDSLGNYDFWIHPGTYKLTVSKVAVGTFTIDNVPIGTQIHSTKHVSGGDDPLDLSLLAGAISGSQISSGVVTNAKVSASAGIVESKLSLNFPTHANTNDPTTSQKAALAGTSGTPDGSNKYVTGSDPRLSDTRAPTAHATTHQVGGSDVLSINISQLVGAGSDLTQSFSLLAHKTQHQLGGADQLNIGGLSGTLADPQKIVVKKGGTTIGTRPTINFVEGGNTTLTVTDNSGANRVDVQVDALAGGGGSGTVTSVAQTVPAWLTIAGSPVTTAGTLAITATSGQTANSFLASPNGGTGALSVRTIVVADIPTLNQNTSGTAADLSATLSVAHGGTNLTAATDDTVMLGNGTTWQSKAVPDCVDTAGNHLNYTASTNTLSCGTSGGGGGSSNSFVTIDAPSGTDPVAGTSTDTLTLVATAPQTVTGSLGANSLTFAVSAATTGATGVVQLATPSSDTTAGHVVQANDARLSDARTPSTHATSHKSGGSDSIKLDELAATTDITTLNASTSAHGLLKKLDNNSAHFLDGTGAWSIPAGGGGGGGGLVTPADYSPDNPPASGLDSLSSDEFTGSITTSLQTWGNQGTATETAEMDSLRLHTAAAGGNDRKLLWYVAPTGVNWVSTTKLTLSSFVPPTTSYLAGLFALESGSIATPTSMSGCSWDVNGSNSMELVFVSNTNYTSAYSVQGSSYASGQFFPVGTLRPVFLQLRYVTSSKNLSCWGSFDGFLFYRIGTSRTLSADPANLGLLADQDGSNVAADTRFYFLRTRTDSAGTTSPYPMGGSGSTLSTEYSPDTLPTVGLDATSSDEFTLGLAASWSWANQGSSTDTTAQGSAVLSTPTNGSRNMRVRWITAPAAGDLTIVTKVTPVAFGSNFNSGGIALLSGGSSGSPTELWQAALFYNGGILQLLIQRYTDYTTQSGTAAGFTLPWTDINNTPIYLLVSYVNSSKVITIYASKDGADWIAHTTTGTLANAPSLVGRYVESDGATPATMRFWFFRTFTAGVALTNPFEIGK